jgi:ubiquinone/menaquinone biosynthesis C-methylase UbiE
MTHSPSEGRYLTPQEARRVYDHIGRFQDWQAFYEGPVLRELLRSVDFSSAKSVFEFGCGTGAFAAKLMTIVPTDCRYVGIDVSPKMTRLATSRLKPWAERATIKLSDGSPALPEDDGAFDHFVSNYVFELLSPDYAAKVLAEAHRILSPNGKLCLVSLGCGTSGLARLVTALWEAVWRRKPEFVGGCRPSDLSTLVSSDNWSIDRHSRVLSFGIVSDVLVASRRSQ